MTRIDVSGFSRKQYYDSLPLLSEKLKSTIFQDVSLSWDDDRNVLVVESKEGLNEDNTDEFLELLLSNVVGES